jgi:hypothetical protein
MRCGGCKTHGRELPAASVPTPLCREPPAAAAASLNIPIERAVTSLPIDYPRFFIIKFGTTTCVDVCMRYMPGRRARDPGVRCGLLHRIMLKNN